MKIIDRRVGLASLLALVILPGVGAPPAAAGQTTAVGLLVQSEWTEPVYIDAGSTVGAASCVNNWGSVPGLGAGAALNQGENNSTSNPITVEFNDGGGGCSDSNSNWLFPFTVIVGANQVPAAMLYYEETGTGGTLPWCQFLNPSQYPVASGGQYPVGPAGATNMACNQQYIGNDAEGTLFYWLSPNPLVVYGSGFDVLMNSVEPNGGGNACQNGWDACLSVQVVPEGASFSTPQAQALSPLGSVSEDSRATSKAGLPPIVMPQPRSKVFASHPNLTHGTTTIRNGHMSVKFSGRLASAANPLLKRAGSPHVRNWVTLYVSTGTGTRTIARSMTVPLGTGPLASKTRTLNRAFTLSEAATSAICRRLSSTPGSALTVSIQQFIAEPGHTYRMDSTREVSSTNCANAN